MFEQKYKGLMDAVEPEESVKRQTLRAMREAERKSPGRRGAALGWSLAAACLLLAASLTLLPRLNGPAAEGPPSAEDARVSSSDSVPGGSRAPSDSTTPKPSDSTVSTSPQPSESGGPEEDVGANRMLEGETKQLTQREVYALPGFGALAPTELIEGGYRFESASLHIDPDGWRSLVLSFTQPMPGLDYVTVTMRSFAQYPEDAARVVSVEDEELYDITRYSIPLADSVPPALQETVWNPIFRAEELNGRALQLRRLARNEGGGDDAAYSMLFSVLCGDTLVQYSIKGDKLDGVLEMVQSSAFYRADAQE